MNALRQFKASKAAADVFLPETFSILGGLPVGLLNDLHVADLDADRHHGTDLLVVPRYRTVGLRVRDPRYADDIAIRAARPSGVRSELDKLRHGAPELILYAWHDGGDRLSAWKLIDAGRLRASGLLDRPREQTMPDGTTVALIPLDQLRRHGCVIAER